MRMIDLIEMYQNIKLLFILEFFFILHPLKLQKNNNFIFNFLNYVINSNALIVEYTIYISMKIICEYYKPKVNI